MITDRTALILIPVVFCFLIIAGCIFPTGSGNTKNTTYQNATQNSSEITKVHSICLMSNNATPYVDVNRIGVHYQGDIFEITGSTNFCTDTKIFLDLRQDIPLQTAPRPGITYNYSHFELSGTSGNVSIQKGNNGINNWSYSANLSGFNRGFYSVNVWNYDTNIWADSNQTVIGSTVFEIQPAKNNNRI